MQSNLPPHQVVLKKSDLFHDASGVATVKNYWCMAPRGVIGILGFGVDGRAVAEFLESQPEVSEVRVFDDRQTRDIRHEISDMGKLESRISHLESPTLDGVSLLFRSPGFRLSHPLIAEAKKRGIPITSSTSYFLQHFPGLVVGITGSNGKTTCTSLIAAMLRAQFGKEHVEEGGNDRKPRLDLLNSQFVTLSTSSLLSASSTPADASSARSAVYPERSRGAQHDTAGAETNGSVLNSLFAVLELSSFQLIDCPVSPDVAVVLNVTPNHLDWHASMEEYVEAKRHIVGGTGLRPVRRKAMAILNQDDCIVKTFAENIGKEVRWFDELSTVNCQPSTVGFKTHPDTIRAAVTTARALGVSEENIMKALSTFRGVPHRIEFVRELSGVSWYNDSSCTTPESAITACEAFPEGTLVLLLGGRDKGMDFSKLYDVIAKRKVRVVPYGEMGKTFEKHIPNTYHLQPNTSFAEVIAAACSLAKQGDSIVLSPACASFDMFANAKERGRIFEEIARAL